MLCILIVSHLLKWVEFHMKNPLLLPDAPIFTMRPNPVGEQVLVVVADWQEDVVTVMLVTDLAGRQVFTQTLTSSLTNLNIGNLPSGLYLVRLTRNGKSIATQKLVKY